MFTGIIEGVGKIYRKERIGEGYRLSIKSPLPLDDVVNGDSIAVNGACLTVTNVGGDLFAADVSNETMSKTTFPLLKASDRVNLEKAMKSGDRLGGHIVTGHVDGVGVIEVIDKRKGLLSVTVPPQIGKQIVQKGSVAVNGVSLTVSNLTKDGFSVAIIPFTIENTTFADLKKGDRVNIECDTLGKYVDKFLQAEEGSNKKNGGVTKELLIKSGYIR